jgi:hypothetical protein
MPEFAWGEQKNSLPYESGTSPDFRSVKRKSKQRKILLGPRIYSDSASTVSRSSISEHRCNNSDQQSGVLKLEALRKPMHLVFQSLNDEKPGFRLALSVAQPENMHHLANKRNLGCRLLSKYDNFGVADVTIRVQEWAHSARSRRLAVSTASIIKKLLRIEDGHLRNLLQNKIRCHFESFHDPFVFNLIAAEISGFLRLSSPIDAGVFSR